MNNDKDNDNDTKTEIVINRAVYKAMWPNQSVNVCEKHAQVITNIGAAIGLQVPLLPLFGDEECINCRNEAKQD